MLDFLFPNNSVLSICSTSYHREEYTVEPVVTVETDNGGNVIVDNV